MRQLVAPLVGQRTAGLRGRVRPRAPEAGTARPGAFPPKDACAVRWVTYHPPPRVTAWAPASKSRRAGRDDEVDRRDEAVYNGSPRAASTRIARSSSPPRPAVVPRRRRRGRRRLRRPGRARRPGHRARPRLHRRLRRPPRPRAAGLPQRDPLVRPALPPALDSHRRAEPGRGYSMRQAVAAYADAAVGRPDTRELARAGDDLIAAAKAMRGVRGASPWRSSAARSARPTSDAGGALGDRAPCSPTRRSGTTGRPAARPRGGPVRRGRRPRDRDRRALRRVGPARRGFCASPSARCSASEAAPPAASRCSRRWRPIARSTGTSPGPATGATCGP